MRDIPSQSAGVSLTATYDMIQRQADLLDDIDYEALD